MRKSFKGVSVVVALLVLTLVFTGCGNSNTTSDSKEPYKIGVLTTLSGGFASFGQDVVDAVQMETDKINAAGGINGHKIELSIVDDGGDKTKAVSGFTKLAEQDKVLAVIGAGFNSTGAAVMPVAARYKIPVFSANPSDESSRALDISYTYFMPQNEIVRAATWVEICKLQGWTKAIGFTTNFSMGTASLAQMEKLAPAAGITFKSSPDTAETDAIDVTPQVMKLKQLAVKTDAQVLIAVPMITTTSLLVKGLKQLGVNIPIVVWDGCADPVMLKVGGAEIEGLYVQGIKAFAADKLPDSDVQKPVIQDFTARYKAAKNKDAGAFAVIGFDAYHMVINALQAAGDGKVDGTVVRDNVEKTPYIGVGGIYKFTATDHDGLKPESANMLYQVKNNKFEFITLLGQNK